jgi:hypothetical protein
LDAAVEFFKRSLILNRATGDATAESDTLTALGSSYWSRGEIERAIDCYEKALLISRQTGDRLREVNILHGLAEWYADYGRRRQAKVYYEHAVGITQAIGDLTGRADTMCGLETLYPGQHGQTVDVSDASNDEPAVLTGTVLLTYQFDLTEFVEDQDQDEILLLCEQTERPMVSDVDTGEFRRPKPPTGESEQEPYTPNIQEAKFVPFPDKRRWIRRSSRNGATVAEFSYDVRILSGRIIVFQLKRQFKEVPSKHLKEYILGMLRVCECPPSQARRLYDDLVESVFNSIKQKLKELRRNVPLLASKKRVEKWYSLISAHNRFISVQIRQYRSGNPVGLLIRELADDLRAGSSSAYSLFYQQDLSQEISAELAYLVNIPSEENPVFLSTDMCIVYDEGEEQPRSNGVCLHALNILPRKLLAEKIALNLRKIWFAS